MFSKFVIDINLLNLFFYYYITGRKAFSTLVFIKISFVCDTIHSEHLIYQFH